MKYALKTGNYHKRHAFQQIITFMHENTQMFTHFTITIKVMNENTRKV